MTAPKPIKTMAGNSMPASSAGANPTVPPNLQQMYAAILQLQATVNELIVNFNAHTHGGVTAGASSTSVTTALIDGGGETAANLFTAN